MKDPGRFAPLVIMCHYFNYIMSHCYFLFFLFFSFLPSHREKRGANKNRLALPEPISAYLHADDVRRAAA